MANVNISAELERILTAVYGEEVRGSIHDAIAALHSAVQNAVTDVAKVSTDTVESYGVAADAKDLQESAMLVRGKLGEEGTTVSLDDVTTSGVYRLVSSVTYTNSPLGTATGNENLKTGWLVVYKYGEGGRNCMQIVYESGASESKPYASYFRNYSTGGLTWTSWQSNNYVIDDTLTIPGQPADAYEVGRRFEELNYTPIAITSLNYYVTTEDGITASNDPLTGVGARVENGTVVNAIYYQCLANKPPVRFTIDGYEYEYPVNGQGHLSPLSISSNKTWTFKVKEEQTGSILPITDSKAATVKFLPRVFWGTAELVSPITSAFIERFRASGSEVSDTLERTIIVTAQEGEYIWYAYPTSFGLPKFICGGFTGGFRQWGVIVYNSIYNDNYDYYIYRSVQPSLGEVTVDIVRAT